MNEGEQNLSSGNRKIELVKGRAKDFLLDSDWWDTNFNKSPLRQPLLLNRLDNPKGFEALRTVVSEVGDVLSKDVIETTQLRKLIDSDPTLPKEILEKIKHRFAMVRYGVVSTFDLGQKGFGVNKSGHRVPLILGLGPTLLDPVTDRDSYMQQVWRNEHEQELTLSEKYKTRKSELISVEDRADILIGAFSHLLAFRRPDVAIGEVLMEVARTLEQPVSTIIEKYEPVISGTRKVAESELGKGEGSKRSRMPIGREFFSLRLGILFSAEDHIRELDSSMEEHGFLWDSEKGSYLNLGLSL